MSSEVSAIWLKVQAMLDRALALLPNLLLASLVFALFLFLGRAARALGLRVADRAHKHRNLGLVLGGLFQWGLVLLGSLVALSIVVPSFRAGNLIELLGIGTVAVGFAFRDVLQNFFAGLLILLTEPFQLGDQIIVSGHEGTVQAIETRATTILTYDGRRVVIPNTTLFTEAVIVNTALEKRRSEYDVGVGVADDIAAARATILAALRDVEGVLRDPAPQVLVVDLADFSVKLRVWWWTDPPRQIHVLEVQSRVLEAIKNAMIAAGIDLPFPTHQILFHDQTEETDGDRRRQREGWPAGHDKPIPAVRRLEQAVRSSASAARPELHRAEP
jgi:small-conductance mechanosensitive channel